MVNFMKPKFRPSKKRFQIENFGHGLFIALITVIILGVTLLGFYGNLIGQTEAAAGINKQISYQGKLLDGDGVAVDDGDYNIKFTIYDHPTSGTPNCLWTVSGTCATPTTIGINVKNGYFSILLGDTGSGHNAISIDFTSDTYYLGITIDSDAEMTPRKRIGSAGYSFNADTVDGFHATSFLRTDAVSTSTYQTVFASIPDGLGVHQGSLYINPSSASGNYTMFGIAVGGTEQFRVDAEGDLYTTGSLNSSSTLQVDGLVTAYGSVDIGDTTSDTLTITARIDSDFVPSTNNTYDIGAFDNAWKDVYASGTLYASSTNVSNSKTAGYQINGGTVLNTLFTANLIIGEDAGANLNSGSTSNTFIGYRAGYTATNTNTGSFGLGSNIGVGSESLYSNIDGYGNIAMGEQSLYYNTVGSANIAIGHKALQANTTARGNTAVGGTALYSNTTGEWNTGIGLNALALNTTGGRNTAIGHDAMYYNITGSYNVAIGRDAMEYNTAATNSVAVGYNAGWGVEGTSNENNIFLGYKSGYGIETGSYNTFLGYQTGDSVTTGASNVLIGYDVDAPTPTTSNHLNLADLYYGDLSSGFAGIGTAFPSDSLTIVGGNAVVGNGSATSTLSPTTFALNDTLSDGVGLFYVDASGNMNASGTIFGGGNNLSDIGAFDNAMKDIYASGTLYIGGSGSTSTIYSGIETGVLNVTTSTATSTFANGIKLNGGCLEDADGNCISYGGTGIVNSGKTGYLTYYPSDGTTVEDTFTDNFYGLYYDAIAGGLSIYNGFQTPATSTLSVNYLSLYDTLNDGIGVFYVDQGGNIHTSGTIYSGSNNDYDIGAFNNAWKDIYASGTIYADSLTISTGLILPDSSIPKNYLEDSGTLSFTWADAEVADKLTISGGTIDDSIIGGSIPAAGTFTDLISTGNTDIGNATSDTLTVTARIDSDFVPSSSNTNDLGISDYEWRNVYASGTIYGDVLKVMDDANVGGALWASSTLQVTGATKLYNTFSTGVTDSEHAGVFYVDTSGNVNASGTISGAGVSLSGDLDPSANNTYDIGQYDLSWKDIYASGTLYASSTNVSNSKTAGYQINGGTVLNTPFTANLILGEEAGYNLIEGSTSNTFIGYRAGYTATNTATTAFGALGGNTAVGSEALFSQTDGGLNVAVGDTLQLQLHLLLGICISKKL